MHSIRDSPGIQAWPCGQKKVPPINRRIQLAHRYLPVQLYSLMLYRDPPQVQSKSRVNSDKMPIDIKLYLYPHIRVINIDLRTGEHLTKKIVFNVDLEIITVRSTTSDPPHQKMCSYTWFTISQRLTAYLSCQTVGVCWKHVYKL